MITLKTNPVPESVRKDIREMGWGARIMFCIATIIMIIFLPLAGLAVSTYFSGETPFVEFWTFFYLSSFALSIPTIVNLLLFFMWLSWRDVTKAPVSENQKLFSLVFVSTSMIIIANAIIGLTYASNGQL